MGAHDIHAGRQRGCEVAALAKLANVAAVEADWSVDSAAANVLLDLGNAGDGERLDGQLARIDGALRNKKIDELRIASRRRRAIPLLAVASLAILAFDQTVDEPMKPARIERRPVADTAMDWPDSVHPVLRRVYAARGITRFEQIDHRLASLHSPKLLGGIERACELIADAIRDDRRIVIVGDFDADGATGTAVAVRGLRMLGACDVGYAVPNRFIHGYGLSAAIVEELVPLKPHLIITVDNGIVAHAGVAAARAHGMRVIVTDHHLPAATLPDADAIVNPNVHGDEFPSKAVAGVGVMFYLLLAVRAYLRDQGAFAQRPEPDLSVLLDLVALGTVADLVPLDYNNRILVDAGLRRVRAGRACAGVAALLDCAKRDARRIVASDFGFAVAPRINAAGRLEDMRIGIECLLTDDASRAQQLAETLSSINANAATCRLP